jgi:hypothetical protein
MSFWGDKNIILIFDQYLTILSKNHRFRLFSLKVRYREFLSFLSILEKI